MQIHVRRYRAMLQASGLAYHIKPLAASIDDFILMAEQLNPTFCRRLLLAHLINTLERPNVSQLMAATGWPRRTTQDVIRALPSFGIVVHFVEDGVRHNDGYYVIDSWGPIDPAWIAKNQAEITTAIT